MSSVQETGAGRDSSAPEARLVIRPVASTGLRGVCSLRDNRSQLLDINASTAGAAGDSGDQGEVNGMYTKSQDDGGKLLVPGLVCDGSCLTSTCHGFAA